MCSLLLYYGVPNLYQSHSLISMQFQHAPTFIKMIFELHIKVEKGLVLLYRETFEWLSCVKNTQNPTTFSHPTFKWFLAMFSTLDIEQIPYLFFVRFLCLFFTMPRIFHIHVIALIEIHMQSWRKIQNR